MERYTFQNNKLVKNKIFQPSLCFDYQGKVRLALPSTGTDFPMMYSYLLQKGGVVMK